MTHNPAEALRIIADEIFERWDKDQRSGKLLTALAGRLPGYRADVDAVLAALTSPAPAGGEEIPKLTRAELAGLFGPNLPMQVAMFISCADKPLIDVRKEVYKYALNVDAEVYTAPPPSPDVAGVVDADLIERVSGRLKQRAHNREQLEGIKASHAIEWVAATLLESLSAEKERLVEALAEEREHCAFIADEAASDAAARRDASSSVGCLKISYASMGDGAKAIAAKIRARTALTPKEKA